MPLDRSRHPSGPRPSLRDLLALCALLSALALPAWAEETPSTAAPDAKAPAKKATPAGDPLVIGTFPVHPDCVVDGDTVRLPKPQGSIRVLGLDCEETFKRKEDRAAATKDFAAYAKAKRGDSPMPVKYATPAGEAATVFARQLMTGATAVRLERDSAGARTKGTYGRVLAHVIILKPEKELNLAVELVRHGHSPYFTKYGRSLRLDKAFRAAQDEAQKAARGIWGSDGPDHYPDYPERLRWWNARADQVDRWRAVKDKADHITLGAVGADAKIKNLIGKEATVFGFFDRELPVSTKDRRVLLLSHERGRGLPLVVFDTKVIEALDMLAFETRYVTVRGKLTLYKGRPQMVIERASQISTK